MKTFEKPLEQSILAHHGGAKALRVLTPLLAISNESDASRCRTTSSWSESDSKYGSLPHPA